MQKQTETGERSADIDLGFLDLNTATEEQLVKIPWISRDCARELVRCRPFSTMDDVRRVPGLSEDTLDMLIRGGATVGDARPEQ